MKAKLLITIYHGLHVATNGIGLLNDSHTLAAVLYLASQMFATLWATTGKEAAVSKSTTLVGTAVVTGAGFYLYRLVRTGQKLQTETSAKIHKIRFIELLVKMSVTLKNLASQSLKFRYPFVALMYGKENLGSSQVVDREGDTVKYGENTIMGITITAPLVSLASLGNEIRCALLTHQPLLWTWKFPRQSIWHSLKAE